MIDSKAFIAELDAIDRMSPDELRVEARKLANEPTLAGFIAKLACIRDAKARPGRATDARRRRSGRI